MKWQDAAVVLPSAHHRVIIYDRNLGMMMIGYNAGTPEAWSDKPNGRALCKLSEVCWMHLPEPPAA